MMIVGAALAGALALNGAHLSGWQSPLAVLLVFAGIGGAGALLVSKRPLPHPSGRTKRLAGKVARVTLGSSLLVGGSVAAAYLSLVRLDTDCVSGAGGTYCWRR